MNIIRVFILWIWLGTSSGMFANMYSPEVQKVNDEIDNLKEPLLKSLEERYSKLHNLQTELEKKESLIRDKTETLNNIISQIDQKKLNQNKIEDTNKKLELENEKLVKQKESLKTKIDEEASQLETVSEKVKAEQDKKDKLDYEIKQLEKEVELIKDDKSMLDKEIVSKNVTYTKIWEKIEDTQNRQSLLDNKIQSLDQEQRILINENKEKEAAIKDLNEEINNKNVHKKDLKDEIMTLKSTIEDLKKERDELKKDNKQLQKEICKEHYTLLNWEFLANNKHSALISVVLALLVGASLPFILKLFAPIKSTPEYNSFNNIKEVLKEASPSRRLEHMSDDEDNEMVPSSSVSTKRDLKYNYDRDFMEEHEDPEKCLDYIKNKYGIKKDLFHDWEALQSVESTEINVWETRNDKLRFTKLLLKKTSKKPKKVLLTFELFQTKLRDAFSYSDYEETELKEKDSRIEAKLAWKIYDGLPDFSV